MAVIFKRKEPVQLIAQEQKIEAEKAHVPGVTVGPTVRQQQTMMEVFGTPHAPDALTHGKVTITKSKTLHGIREGMAVTITNDKFPWVEIYKPGDTGVVEMICPQAQLKATLPGFDPTKHGLYMVRLDKPRVPGFDKVDLQRWAIEPRV